MPNIAKVLREEISRIARKESKSAVTPLRKISAKLRPDIANLKNRVAELEKEVKRLSVMVINLASVQPAPAEATEAGRAWISGNGVKSLRKKLGLSQGEFGKLTGVSTGAVTVWESKTGMLKLRDATKKSIMAVRGVGKVEARKRLDEMAPAKVKKAKVAKGKPRGKKAARRRK